MLHVLYKLSNATHQASNNFYTYPLRLVLKLCKVLKCSKFGSTLGLTAPVLSCYNRTDA